MSDVDIEALLTPLDAAAPCGADLEYDESFRAMEEALRGKPEQQYGDTVIAAEGSDWRRVMSLALALGARSRDLRVAVNLLRARLHLEGLQACGSGLALIHGLLDRHWPHVHPMLDVDDGNDPTMRLNALAPLVDPGAVLADLRTATLGGPRSGISGRSFELVAGKALPREGENVLGADAFVQALRELEARQPGCVEALRGVAATTDAIDALLVAQVGTEGPDLKPLQQYAQMLSRWAGKALASQPAAAGDAAVDAEVTDSDAGPAAAGAAAAAAAAPGGAIRNREDAIRQLQRVCEWIELNEPSNPVPLLLRRAQRLMRKSFIDIIRDLVPDGVGAVEHLAGPADP